MRRLSSGALWSLERSERLGDGCHAGTRFNRGGTGDVNQQRLAVLFRAAQIGVGLDERFLLHDHMIAILHDHSTALGLGGSVGGEA